MSSFERPFVLIEGQAKYSIFIFKIFTIVPSSLASQFYCYIYTRQPKKQIPTKTKRIKMVWTKVLLPRQIVTLMKTMGPNKGVFRVDPKMTKHEVKEYLTKVYNLPVRKVNTVNYEGKLKTGSQRHRGAYYRTKAYKKAYVLFDNLEATVAA